MIRNFYVFFSLCTVFLCFVYGQFDGGFGGFNNAGGGLNNINAQPKENNDLNSFLSSQQREQSELSGLMGGSNNHDSSSFTGSTTDDANSDLLKQVNSQDGRIQNFLSQGNDDQSVRELLKSFQLDDTKGNYQHHGEHGDYGEASNMFSEDRIKQAVESNPDTRDSGYQQTSQDTSFNSPNYLVTKEVELEISTGNRIMGVILIGLFGNTVPKTVANFADLADHTRGFGYRGSRFHRVINNFMIQGGDITKGDGTGGRSIYGAQFPDENFNIKMNGAGWACMANAGKDTNDSQFFITTADTPWLNGHHVCFGKVLKGMATVYAVQDAPKANDKPLQDVIISNSHSIPVDRPFETSTGAATE